MSDDARISKRLHEAAAPLSNAALDVAPSDLTPLAEAFHDARVVALGEATHGTREFFALKHRLLRLLVTDHGFRTVAIEANCSATLALDEYVCHGTGDAERALRRIGFWPWHTESMLSLIEWIRAFNDGRDPEDCVRLFGYDVQYTAGPARRIRAYLRRVDEPFLESVGDELRTLETEQLFADDGAALGERLEMTEALVETLTERLQERREEYVNTTSERAWHWARRHARVLEQAFRYKTATVLDDAAEQFETRDAFMAENVSWLLDRATSDRITLWGHNVHVQQRDHHAEVGPAPTMGTRLADEYGSDYYALGLDFGRGSFRAVPSRPVDDSRDVREFSIAHPPQGSMPDLLEDGNLPACFLDLDEVGALEAPRQMHAIGAVYATDDPQRNYTTVVPSAAFDGLLFVAETSASIGLN